MITRHAAAEFDTGAGVGGWITVTTVLVFVGRSDSNGAGLPARSEWGWSLRFDIGSLDPVSLTPAPTERGHTLETYVSKLLLRMLNEMDCVSS